jgi:hypothetical protein
LIAATLAAVLGGDPVAAVEALEEPALFDLGSWDRQLRPDGIELIARGADVLLRIDERMHAPPPGLIDRAAEELCARARGAAIERRHVLTRAGEIGALLWLADDGDGAACARAWILGDDRLVELGAVGRAADGPSIRAVAIDAMHEVVIGPGPARLRRCLFDPPRGWRGEARGLHADFWAPDQPDALITIAPATPCHAPDAARWDRLMRGALDDPAGAAEPVRFAGCAGERTTSTRLDAGRELEIEIVSASDARFTYLARLEAPRAGFAAARAAFDQVIASLRPIAGPRAVAAHSAFAAWLD